MNTILAILSENKKLTSFSLFLTVTILGLIFLSLWIFKQPNTENHLGYITLIFAFLVLIIAKLGYNAGVEEAKYTINNKGK